MSTQLDNPQYELFAQEIANGKTAVEAYRAVAGIGMPGEQAMGSRWLTRADVQRRVADLIRDHTAAATMTAAERREICRRDRQGQDRAASRAAQCHDHRREARRRIHGLCRARTRERFRPSPAPTP